MPKKEAEVETWYACDGKGIVYLSEPGEMPAYAVPDSLSDVVGKLEHIEGYCPETYSCKGYKDGWFAIEINGDTGYVREGYVFWDVLDSF